MKILRELREQAGMTLREVEEATGVSNAYLSQLETGKIKKPSATVIYKLSQLYGYPMDKLSIAVGIVSEQTIIPAVMRPTLEDRIRVLEEKVKALEVANTIHHAKF